jgi:hypothetical protein
MYKWPVDISASMFEGLVIEAITFTENSIMIRFPEHVLVSVGYHLDLYDSGLHEPVPVPAQNTRLNVLLGRTVLKSFADEDGASLILDFGNDVSIRIAGDDPYYECYEIMIGEKRYFV